MEVIFPAVYSATVRDGALPVCVSLQNNFQTEGEHDIQLIVTTRRALGQSVMQRKCILSTKLNPQQPRLLHHCK